MSILQSYHWMIKNRSWELEAKKKALTICFLKINWVIVKQLLLASAKIFKKAGTEGVKEDKRCWIFCELGSVKKKKKSPRQLFKSFKIGPRNI